MLPQNKPEWEKRINTLKKQEQPISDSKDNIVKELATRVENTVMSMARQAQEKGNIGVLFSGGVDSTLIAHILKKNNVDFMSVTVGFHDDEQKLPEDIVEAKESAEFLKLEREEVILNFDEAETILRETITLLGNNLANAVNVGVGSVEVAGIKAILSKHPDVTQWFGGLGSEEIFAGYKRHADASDKHEECWNGLKAMFERDLLRDFAIAKQFGINFWVPFLDEELIAYAMNIPIELKISTDNNKIIIRDVAVYLGLPEKFSFRPKRAAQYGSRTDNALAKIAKRNGFKYKKDFISYVLKPNGK